MYFAAKGYFYSVFYSIHESTSSSIFRFYIIIRRDFILLNAYTCVVLAAELYLSSLKRVGIDKSKIPIPIFL